jgi:hypothetical protein
MYEYLRLGDDTQISYSAVREDGTVYVTVEQPVDFGFHSATCLLPAYRWVEVDGFTSEELDWYQQFLRNNAPLIMKYAWEGGHVYA